MSRRYRYEHLPESQYLFDTTNGHVCALYYSKTIDAASPASTAAPAKDAQSAVNPFDQIFAGQRTIPVCDTK
jgi:hypothetical protein